MLLKSGLRTAPWAHRRRGPFRQTVPDVRLQEGFNQRQHGAVGDLFLQEGHQAVVGNRVKVAFQVGVHDVDVTGLEKLIDPSQGVFAAAPRPEPVAVLREVGWASPTIRTLKDGGLRPPYKRPGRCSYTLSNTFPCRVLIQDQ